MKARKKWIAALLCCLFVVLAAGCFMLFPMKKNAPSPATQEPAATPLAQATYATKAGYEVLLGDDSWYREPPFSDDGANTYTPSKTEAWSGMDVYFTSPGRFDFALKLDPDKTESHYTYIEFKYFASYDVSYPDPDNPDDPKYVFDENVCIDIQSAPGSGNEVYYSIDDYSESHPMSSYDLSFADLEKAGDDEKTGMIQTYFKGGNTWCHFTLEAVKGARIIIDYGVDDAQTDETGFALKILDCVNVKATAEGNGKVQYKNTTDSTLDMSWEKGVRQTLTAVPSNNEFVYWTDSQGKVVGEGNTLTVAASSNETYTAHFGEFVKQTSSGGEYFHAKGGNAQITYTFSGEQYVTFQYSYLWGSNTAKAFKASLDGNEFISFSANNGHTSGKLDQWWTDLTAFAKGNVQHTLTISFSPKVGDTGCELGIRNIAVRTSEEMEEAGMMVTVPIEYNEKFATMTMNDKINGDETIPSGELKIAKYRYVSFTATQKEDVPAEFAPGTYETILFQSWNYGGSTSTITQSSQSAKSTTSQTIYFDGSNIFEQRVEPSIKGKTSTLGLDVRAIAPLGDIYLMVTNENNEVVQQQDEQGELVDQRLIKQGDSLTAIFGKKYTYTFMVPTLETLKGGATTLTGSIVTENKDDRFLRSEYSKQSATIEDQDGYDYYVFTISGTSGSEYFRFTRSIEGYCNSNIQPDGSTDYSCHFTINFKTAEEKVAIDQIIDEQSKEFVSITAQSPDPWIVDFVHSTVDYYAFKPSNITTNTASTSSLTFNIKKAGILYFRCYFICNNAKYNAAYVKLGSKTLLKGSGYTTPDINETDMVESRYVNSVQIYECNIPVVQGQNKLSIALNKLDNSSRNSCFAIWDVKFIEEKTVTVNHKASDDLGQTYGTTSFTGTNKSGKTLTFTATPDEGSIFYGWVDNATGEIVSKEKTFTYTPIYEEVLDFTAVMAPEGSYVAQHEGHFYTTLEEALEKTTGSSSFGATHIKKTVIYLLSDYTLSNGEATIPENVMLVVPYDAAGHYDGTGDLKSLPSSAYSSWNNTRYPQYKDPFRTLTIAEGTTLKVYGTLMLGGVLGDSYQGAQGHTSAFYSKVILDGTVIVESGGAMDVRGLVTGKGHIEVKGTVQENGQGTPGLLFQPFLILDYNGGQNAYDTFNADLTPFKMYAMVNIQCEGGYTINYGGLLYGHSSLHSGYGYTTTDQVFIGFAGKVSAYSKINAPIYLEKGAKAEVKYNGEHEKVGKIADAELDEFNFDISNLNEIGQTTITITGGATTGYMDFTYVDTSVVYFAVPYNYSYILKSGDYTIASLLKFMPGSSLIVEEGATLTVDPSKADAKVKGVGLHIYDAFLIPGLNGLDKRTYPSGKMLEHAGYTSYASFVVNGKFVLKKGASFVGTVQNTNAANSAQHVDGKGEIVIEEGVTLEEKLHDGVATIYSCNYTEYTFKAQFWNKVDNVFCELVAGQSYYATDGAASFSLPGIEFKIEQNVDEEHAHKNKNHTLISKTTPVAEGLTGSWMIVHEAHVYPEWKDVIPTAEEPIKSVSGVCTAIGCGFEESSYLLYTPENIGSLIYRGAAFTAADLEALFKAYYKGLAESVTVTAELESDPTDAGNYTVTFTLTGAYFKDGEGFTATHTFAWTVEKAEITEVTVQGDYIYNGNAQTPNVTVKAGGLTLDPEDYTLEAANNTDAGNASVTVTAVGSSNYTGSATATFEIAAKDISDATVTVTTPAEEIVYTGKDITVNYTVTLTGFDAVTVQASYESNLAAGQATLTVTGTGNFTGTAAATFIIRKKPITVTADAQGKTYDGLDGTLNGEAWTILQDALAEGDTREDLTVTLRWETDAAPKNAGSYTIVGDGSADNYEITVTSGTYTIEQAEATLTIDDVTRAYGEENVLTFNVTGLVGDETIDDKITLSTTADKTSGVGEYDITAAIAEIQNYHVNWEAATLTVTARKITITIENKTSVYTGNKPTLGSAMNADWKVTDGTLVNNDDLGVELSIAAADKYVVNTYQITGTAKNEIAKNYDITWVNGTYTITEAEFEGVQFNAKTVTYNGETQTLEVTGAPDGTAVTYTCDGKPFEGAKDAAVYEITATLTLANYKSKTLTSTLTIEKKAITVAIDAQTAVYNGKQPTLRGDAWTDTNHGIVGSDDLQITLSLKGGVSKWNVGTYDIEGVAANTNYDVTFTGGERAFTITAKQISVKISDQTSVYDGTEPTVAQDGYTVSAETVVDGDDLQITLTKEAGVSYRDGGYAITGVAANTNYDVTFTNGTYTIQKRLITVKIGNQSAVYTGKKPAVGSAETTNWKIAAGEVVTGETLGVTLSIEAADKYHAGNYKILGDWQEKTNYDVTFEAGTFTIAKKAITVKIGTSKDVAYNGEMPEIEADIWTAEGLAAGDGKEAVKVTLRVVAKGGAWDAGVYEIDAAAESEDYTVTVEKGSVTVTKAKLTVEVKPHTAVYTGQAPVIGAEEGQDWTVKEGEIYKSDDLGLTFTTKSVHAGKYTLDCAYTNGNYDVTFTGGGLEITAKEIEVELKAQASVYGEAISVSQDAYEVSGVVGEDDLQITLTKADGTAAGTYDIEGKSENGDYKVTFTGGTDAYTIQKRNITVTIGDQTAVYSGTEPAVKQSAWQAENAVEGDDLGITLTKQAGTDAGTYAITGVCANANYNAAFTNGTFIVEKQNIGDTIVLGGKEEGGKVILSYTGKEIALTASAAQPVTVVLDPPTLKETGDYTVNAAIEDKNYCGSKTFSVTVKVTGYTENLTAALHHLEEIAGTLTAEALTAEDFEVVKEIVVTLATLNEEEKAYAAEDLKKYITLVDAWNADVDEEVIETAHAVADAAIGGLFALSALAALAYVALRRKY